MNNSDLFLYFDDILGCLNKVETYITGLSLINFREDEKTLDAVIRNFEVIGEAVKKIPDDFKNKHPEVSWRSASGMRDTLIHDYPNIVPDVVWKTAVEDLPIFKKQILKIVVDLNKQK